MCHMTRREAQLLPMAFTVLLARSQGLLLPVTWSVGVGPVQLLLHDVMCQLSGPS